MEKLSNIANESETAKNVFEIFAARERFRRETNLSRLQRYMHEAGKKVVEDELLGLFKKLETAGIGTLVVGRGNRNTRFKMALQPKRRS
jgi:ribosomal protein L18E